MLYLLPQNWFYYNGNINCIGYTPEGRSVYVKICSKSTYLLKFLIIPDENMISTVRDYFSSSFVQITSDPNILIVRASSNINIEQCKSFCEILINPAGPILSLLHYNNISPYNWLQIEKFIPLPGHISKCDINIITEDIEISQCTIRLPYIQSKTINIMFKSQKNKVYIYSNDVRKKYVMTYDGVSNMLNELNATWTISKPDRIIVSPTDWEFLQNLFQQYNINIPYKFPDKHYGYHITEFYDKNLFNDLGIIDCNPEQAIFNIDPTLCFNKHRQTSTIDLCVHHGLYKNVYVYDYTKMYIKILLADSKLKILAHRLKTAPPELIAGCYGFLFSYDTIRDYLLSQNFTHDIINIDPTTIKLKSYITTHPELLLSNKYDHYLNLGISGNISVDNNFNVSVSGAHYLCRPKFPLIIKHILAYFYPEYTVVENLSDYILTIEVKNILFTSCSIEQQLAVQYEKDISCSIFLQYYMTPKCPILLCKNKHIQLNDLDQKYYQEELSNYFEKLFSFKRHY